MKDDYIENIQAITEGEKYSVACPYGNRPFELISTERGCNPTELVLKTNGPKIYTTILDGSYFKGEHLPPIILLNSTTVRKEQLNIVTSSDEYIQVPFYMKWDKANNKYVYVTLGPVLIFPTYIQRPDDHKLFIYTQAATEKGAPGMPEDVIPGIIMGKYGFYQGRHSLHMTFTK